MQVDKLYKIAVIEENLIPRAGITSQINKLQDFEVIESRPDFVETAIKWNQLDAVFLSSRSIEQNFYCQLEKLRDEFPSLPLILLAVGITRDEQYKLINLGINALLVEELTKESLTESLFCTVNNGIYFPPIVLRELRLSSNKSTDGILIKVAFSDMQKEILQLLANGLSAPKVAKNLFRAVRTIEWHKEQMMKMTGTCTTLQLVLFALEYGIITSPYMKIAGRPTLQVDDVPMSIFEA